MENLQRLVDSADWLGSMHMNELETSQAAQPNNEIPPKCRGSSCANKWLSFFVVEVCRQDSEHYPEAMLHEILCGIQHHVQKQKPRERSRVCFWGMFLMHKWRICVRMVLEVVRNKMNLSLRRKKIVYGSLEFWVIRMHRHYWIQWYGCVICTLHYAVE